jgi:hypothetical protein
VWFGDIRLRVVYDPIIIVLAVAVYAEVGRWARSKIGKRRAAAKLGKQP